MKIHKTSIIKNCEIDDSVKIGHFSYLKNCKIYKGVTIGSNCELRDVTIDENTVIWNFCNLYGCKIGQNCIISSQVQIETSVLIGNQCKIGFGSFLPEGTCLENNIFVGPKVIFTNDKWPKAINDNGELATKDDWKLQPSIVKNGAVISAGCCILPNLIIGENSILGAASLLTHNIGNGELWLGSPAKPQIKDEEWRDVIGYEGLYQVSNYGRILSFIKDTNGYEVRLSERGEGYLGASFTKGKTKSTLNIHRVVADAFIPKPDIQERLVVNHKNGNKSDNRVTNLEWVTYSENTRHAFRIGLLKMPKGKDSPHFGKTGKLNVCSKKIAQIDPKTRNIIRIFDSVGDAGRFFGCGHSGIAAAARGKTKSSQDYFWKYVD
jgi:UDP-2-acetamido-3-amino-2,3-dideoxy-glucuronate N-acetyltransferase